MSAERWRKFLPPSLHALFFRKQAEQELAEEFEYHLEMKIQEGLDSGLNPDEARNAAMRAMGGMEQCKEVCRDARGFRWISEFRQDAHYAFRMLAKALGFTIVTVLLLALGIGANTAVFSILDLLIFRPLPFGKVEQLAWMPPGSNYVNYLDIKDAGQSFIDIAAVDQLAVSGRAANGRMLTGRAVSANFFQIVGLPMTIGRGFLPGEDRLYDGQQVAVISHRYWEKYCERDAAIIGKSIELNKLPFTIVGVGPENLIGDLRVAGTSFDIWIPLPMNAKAAGLDKTPMWRDAIENRKFYPFLDLVGRLKPGIAPRQARIRMATLISNIKKQYPESFSEGDTPFLEFMNTTRWPKEREARFFAAVLMASGLCLLLIACTNAATILLARCSARQQEIATRRTLGASSGRIVRQLLAEGFFVSSIALLIGLAIYLFLLRLFYAWNPLGDAPYLQLGIDSRTLLYAAGISLIAYLMFSLAPALAATRVELSGALKKQGFLGMSTTRWRRILVCGQVVLTVVLLTEAGLFGRTVLHFLSINPGFDTNVEILSQGEEQYRPNHAGKMMYYRRILEQLNQQPGVRSVAWGVDAPFDPQGFMSEQVHPEGTTVVGNNKWVEIRGNSVSAGYFKTLSIPMLQGRDFSEADSRNAKGALIINESLARRFWPDTTPLGKLIRIKKAPSDEFRSQGPEICEVIGVVKDVKYKEPWEESKPYIYYPYWHWFYDSMRLYVSVQSNSNISFDRIREICDKVDPNIKIIDTRSIATQLKPLLAQERSAAFLLGISGLLGIALAAIGLYGIISYSVAQRSREFGIRIAIGAQKKHIFELVIAEGIIIALIGFALGLAFSLLLSTYTASRLHGLNPLNPAIYTAVLGLLIFIVFFAAFLPARRASVNPIKALRVE